MILFTNQKVEIEVHCDASMFWYGADLLQKNSTTAEEKSPSYQLEVLAIVQALKKCRIYLLC